jgi:hypothetical protein
MAVADSVDIKIHLKISKPIFAMISQLSPMAFVAKGYAKEEANSLIYDVALIKGELKVNGQALQ